MDNSTMIKVLMLKDVPDEIKQPMMLDAFMPKTSPVVSMITTQKVAEAAKDVVSEKDAKAQEVVTLDSRLKAMHGGIVEQFPPKGADSDGENEHLRHFDKFRAELVESDEKAAEVGRIIALAGKPGDQSGGGGSGSNTGPTPPT